jgi:hypothetical protein
LKKLDEDSLDQDSQTGEQKIKMRQVGHRRTKTPRSVYRFRSISLVLLLLIIAVGIVWIIMSSSSKPSMIQKQDATSPKLPVTKSTQNQQVPTLKKEPGSQSHNASRKIKTAGMQKSPNNNTRVYTELKTSEQPPEPKKIKKAPVPIRTRMDKTSAQKTDDGLEIKSSKHPEFSLSGVLWSNTPGKRVALINGRYVKEGDEIKGVSVIRIEKKQVTLQSGEETWTIKLKK